MGILIYLLFFYAQKLTKMCLNFFKHIFIKILYINNIKNRYIVKYVVKIPLPI